MRVLIIFDSKYGNTEKVARAIGESSGIQVLHVDDIHPVDLTNCDLLIIGSPTHGGFPTEGIHRLVKDAPDLHMVNAAAFDTRTKTTVFGYAAPKIGRNLKKKGAAMLVQPEGFLVVGMEGPLMEGELERARNWARSIMARDSQ
jgi:flavodoxin